jgi:hypothetical protein
MINLPITKEELDKIIEVLKHSHPKIYTKLWSYKVNYLNMEKNNGLS